jgi:hypothetical protein
MGVAAFLVDTFVGNKPGNKKAPHAGGAAALT